ncbi:Uncharacterised protein [Alloiococcus otitis]|uniref:Phage shock protein B n=1 Tax=Alloiococcus otitis ATCC 51267 TaxID=883081 RepID=K9E848_9LACT|nr:hypothetical protein [Alloiococcus otitis]EKU92838.1 hypothetical protein HMPREF9698_01622 [Alloiococcus otitis ATCC 51267]SUU80719.1 Uncharacterised protein [Alloiococcus otitis]SUU91709.1 Uncharacterised protein [Alloiococcus otitis]
MEFDVISIGAIAGAIITILTLAKLVVEPFTKVMKRNDETMKHLRASIDTLSRDMQASRKETEDIKKIIDNHEIRIGQNEDNIIRHSERIAKNTYKIDN